MNQLPGPIKHGNPFMGRRNEHYRWLYGHRQERKRRDLLSGLLTYWTNRLKVLAVNVNVTSHPADIGRMLFGLTVVGSKRRIGDELLYNGP